MAMIKCPECGHLIDDSSKFCPECGNKIAGHLNIPQANTSESVKPTNSDPAMDSSSYNQVEQHEPQHRGPQDFANNYQQGNNTYNELQQPVNQQPVPGGFPPPPPRNNQTYSNTDNRQATQPGYNQPNNNINGNIPPVGGTPNGPQREQYDSPKKNNTGMIIGIIIGALVLLVGLWFIFGGESPTSEDKEIEAYAYAMSSSDKSVLQSYLDTYPEASQAHRDSITAHLERLKNNDQEWNNALVSGTKSALEEYLSKHPDTPHKSEIYEKFDSLDWNVAKVKNTADAYKEYISAHADGKHTEEAEDAMKKLKSKEIQPEEKTMISGLFNRFFQSINTRNEASLKNTCEETLTSFLGKSQASKNDVVTFMEKLYKADVSRLTWATKGKYDIKKREVGDEEYEYTVSFNAEQEVETETETTVKKYKITSKVSPDGKISELNMNKIIE